MIIFRHNFIGAQSQFAPFAPSLAKIGSVSLERAETAFVQAHAILDPFFDGPRVMPYSNVRIRERREIAKSAIVIRDAMFGAAEDLKLL